MPAPKKYDAETQERAVRMYRDRLDEHGGSKVAARRHVGELLSIAPATLRDWVERDEAASPGAPKTEPDVSEELARLRREVSELRKANEILKTASAFFAAAEVDRRLR
ncbi:mobile element protein [Rhodococcus wratislaviensis]|uniref:Mobile element protein n=1 Tax=Rhodococcus wratislaviensis TaxID=44752 RepID=A0A402CCC2_RHOWR|nr:mobile element protein [Rhodococcus wratislaviensis]